MKSVIEYSTYGVELNEDKTPNSRARLDTGKFCNYDCEFCYYKKQLADRTDLDVIKSRIDKIYEYGIKEVDLSGGESSVEPNWFNILDYCAERGLRVSCLSHGGKFANIEFLKKSYDHGLREVLFSLHGHNEEVHDKITNRVGSFVKILQAIENCKKLNIKVRVNCTVYDLNYKHLEGEYSNLILKLNPSQVNYILINYDSDNSDFRFVDYGLLTTAIKKSILKIKSEIDNINVRYVPFCYMEGFEKYVVNYYQHIYDLEDWNLALYNMELDTSIQYSDKEKLRQSYHAASINRINGYHKPKECLECKYLFICDGVENQLKGTKLIPVDGDKINDVMHFR